MSGETVVAEAAAKQGGGMSDPISGIIQGGLQAGGTVLAGYMQNKANKEMNADNLRLAYIQRADTLAQSDKDNRFAVQDRAYRDRESAYQKLIDRREAARQRLQDDMAFRNNIIAAVSAAPRRW